ncbi:MAG: hypothetical protein CVU88_01910 [Firmicutes bacterium HGW-Firmicutes-13]|nr:MAG: hypothetical protein CVU88_01910 [Firmicutes bacterium HGW-Firmicutes-13]
MINRGSDVKYKWQGEKITKGPWKQGLTRWKAAVMVFCLFLCYFGGLFVNQHFKMKDMQVKLSHLEKAVEEAVSENKKLEKEVELLHDYEYIETLARKELGLIKSGEVLFKVDNDRYVFQEKKR